MGLTTELPQDWGKRLLEGTDNTWCAPGPRRKESDPTRDWASLACECPGVSSGAVCWQWPVAGSEELNIKVLGAAACWHKSYWRRSSLPLITAWPEAKRGWHSPTHQWRIGLKIYWAWPRPSEQDSVCPTDSTSHKEASTSLLSFSITGQEEWKT